jgi:hypothetical protein
MTPHSLPPWACMPAEILDLIFAFLCGKQSLSDCALVCRFWLPHARYRLFTTLTIRRQIGRFSKELSLSSSPLPECVTTLQIGTVSTALKLEKGMLSAIARLHRLKSLKLCNLEIASRLAYEFGTLKKISTLEGVEIKWVTVPTSSQYLDILRTLATHVRCISLDRVPLFEAARAPTDFFLNTALRNLKLNIVDDCFLDWICMQEPIPAINALYIHPCLSAGRLLEKLGVSLTEIHMASNRS